MPARSAIRATSTMSSQRACQRSGTVVSVSPPSALAEKMPSLNGLGPWIGWRRHTETLAYFGCFQSLGFEHTLQALHRLVDIDMADDERRDAEADGVGLAEGGDHALIDQRFDHRAGAGRREADIAAAPCMIVGRRDLDAERSAFLAREARSGNRSAICAWPRVPAGSIFGQMSSRGLASSLAPTGGVPVEEALDARMRLVIAGEGEDIGMAHPAGDAPAMRAIGKAGLGIDVGRAAGAGAEIFVAAADGEIGIRFRLTSTGTAPAECETSQTVSTPLSCAASVTRCMSQRSPER